MKSLYCLLIPRPDYVTKKPKEPSQNLKIYQAGSEPIRSVVWERRRAPRMQLPSDAVVTSYWRQGQPS